MADNPYEAFRVADTPTANLDQTPIAPPATGQQAGQPIGAPEAKPVNPYDQFRTSQAPSATTSPYAEPDAGSWLGRRWQDIRGKQDPRFKDVAAFDWSATGSPMELNDNGADWRTVEQAKALGTNDEGLAAVTQKALGDRFVRMEHDANGYPMVVFKGPSGGEERRYINKPGMDWQDVDRGLMGALPYVVTQGIAGKALKGAGLLANMGAQAVAGGGTSLATDMAGQAIGTEQPTDLGKAGIISAISAAVPVVGKVIDHGFRTYGPGVSEGVAVARNPAAHGVKLIERSAGYDEQPLERALEKLTVRAPSGMTQTQADDVARLSWVEKLSPDEIATRTGLPADAVADVARQEKAIQSAYRDMNVIEVLRTGELQGMPGGSYAPEVITTRNLNGVVRDAANTEGAGQNIANMKYAQRKQQAPFALQSDIDAYFGSAARETDAAAVAAQKAAMDARYTNFRKRTASQTIKPETFGPRLTQNPEFQKALEYAANAEISAPGYAGKVPISQMPALESGAFELTPANVLDVSHYLSKAARGLQAGTPEQMRAVQLKNQFQNWVNQEFSKKFKGLNEDYALFKRIMDARDYGADLATKSGAAYDEAYKFFANQQKSIPQQVEALNTKIAEMQAKADAATTPQLKGRWAKQVQSLTDRRDMHAMVVDELRKSFGEAVKDRVADARFGRAAPVNDIVTDLLSQNQQKLLQEMLGPEQGREFIQTLFGYNTRKELGETLYGGPDTAYKLQRAEGRRPVYDVAAHVVTGKWGSIPSDVAHAVSTTYKQNANDQINRMMAEQGVDAVRSMLKTYVSDRAKAAPLHAPAIQSATQATTPALVSGAAGGEPSWLARDTTKLLRGSPDIYAKARSALSRGAPADKVRQRLIERGIDPAGAGL